MSRLATTLFISRRYAAGRRRYRFGFLVRLFSFLAMTLGVASLILVLSVMNGFRTELTDRFLRILPHATIYPDTAELRQSLDSNPGVLAWSPVLEDIAGASAGGMQSPVSLTGVDTQRDPAVVNISDILIEGDWESFAEQRFGVLLGSQLARNLGARPGNNIRITLPAYQLLPTGIYPRVRNFQVMGIFTSSSQLDGEVALIRLQDAEILFRGVAARSGIRVRTPDADNPGAVLQGAVNGGRELVTWQQRLDGLYEAIQLEKMVVSVMLVAVIFVAAFSLVASLMMSVAEKRTDIAVMRTMGARSSTILGIFLFQGMLFGGLGVLLGALVGSLLAIFLEPVANLVEQLMGASLFDPSVFYISYLPSQWQPGDVVAIVLAAMLIALLASILPAWHASRVAPAEAIHYNN